MSLRLYNTLTRQKEEFKPLEGNTARIYSCGPTVYSYAHIGNLRTYVFMDILRRAMTFHGFDLQHVMNITDVGHLTDDGDAGADKMAEAARKEKKTPLEIAEYYTSVFMKDTAALNIGRPEIVARATEHIQEMLDFVVGLCDKGFGYETSDGIYFDVEKFAGYGKLSRINLEEQLAGARVEVNEEKHHPADFALWKKAPKEHIMQWPSPWGMGYPGWHIECSAMGRKYLGDVFDIHTGGVDHIPIHHENEIAQSEALLGHPAVKSWLHGEFLLVDNGKMSKSLGNVWTIANLEERGFAALSYRYFCLNGHYRNKLNFTWDALAAAQTAYFRLLDAVLAHKDADGEVSEETLTAFRNEFVEAISDDLNIPKALGVAWNLVRHPQKSRKIFALLMEMDQVLGLNFGTVPPRKEDEVPQDVLDMLEARQAARKSRDFAESDRIRDALKAMGWAIEDTAAGPKAKKL